MMSLRVVIVEKGIVFLRGDCKEDDMARYKIKFKAIETCINNCKVYVEASSKEEAYKKAKEQVDNHFDHEDFSNTDWDGFNGINEETMKVSDFQLCEFDEVEEVDESPYCELKLSAQNIIELGETGIKQMVSEKFERAGLEIDKNKPVKMIPIGLEEHFVTYKCIPVLAS